jgi:phospholipid-binding lipoprotein MlaA
MALSRLLAGSPVMVAALVLALAGCATRPDPATDPEGYAEYVETNDPIEPFNRGVFEFNRGVDTMLLKPLGIIYQDILPPVLQTGVGNVLDNLTLPTTFANQLLQGEFAGAGDTVVRLLINSTVGLGGILDPATDWGWGKHNEDFGQTLAVWGLGEGPYLMLPVLGPSNPRDGVGRGVDSFALDPFGVLNAATGGGATMNQFAGTRAVTSAARLRGEALEPLDELERTSLDFYAALRSAFRQNREKQIREGRFRTPDAVNKP